MYIFTGCPVGLRLAVNLKQATSCASKGTFVALANFIITFGQWNLQ